MYEVGKNNGYRVGKNPCPACRKKGEDHAGDNFYWYGDGKGGYCWKCNYTVLSDDEAGKRGIDVFDWTNELEEEVSTKEPLTKEEIEKIKGYTTQRGYDLRGIPDWAYAPFYVRHKVDTATGKPVEQYYPIFKNGVLTGFKVRQLPKTFYTVGSMGAESDLFGQHKFRNSNSKKVLITAGEVDAMSAYAMLNKPDSEYEPTPVVSAVVGETASFKQLKNHYEWLNRFEQIIVCYDNDHAGQNAVKKLVDVLPKGKMYVMNIDLKDANEMLVQDRSRHFLNAFLKAKPYTPDGVVSSAEVMDDVIVHVQTKKIPLPPFMHRLQKLMASGIPTGCIVNLGGASGQGKSTLADEMLYYWIFNSPYKVGILSLESDTGSYGTKLLSRHLETKIELIESIDEKLELLQSEDVIAKSNELWCTPDGQPRFYLIDERDGGLESVKEQIMRMIVQCDCRLIIIDPTTDLIDSLTNEQQAAFMSWQKGLVKSHKVTIINILHTRKTVQGQKAGSTGASLHEEDFHGNSSLYKSAAANILFSRNKESDDEVEKNTMYLKLTKCRWTGNTSPVAGKYYYDNKSHKLYDFDDYWSSRGNVEF